jgi:hypothetical protein
VANASNRETPIVKTIVAVFIAVIAVSSPALAADCDADLRRINVALTKDGISPEAKAQAEDMRNQAASLCKAGNAAEAADVIAEAKSLLGVE